MDRPSGCIGGRGVFFPSLPGAGRVATPSLPLPLEDRGLVRNTHLTIYAGIGARSRTAAGPRSLRGGAPRHVVGCVVFCERVARRTISTLARNFGSATARAVRSPTAACRRLSCVPAMVFPPTSTVCSAVYFRCQSVFHPHTSRPPLPNSVPTCPSQPRLARRNVRDRDSRVCVSTWCRFGFRLGNGQQWRLELHGVHRRRCRSRRHGCPVLLVRQEVVSPLD